MSITLSVPNQKNFFGVHENFENKIVVILKTFIEFWIFFLYLTQTPELGVLNEDRNSKGFYLFLIRCVFRIQPHKATISCRVTMKILCTATLWPSRAVVTQGNKCSVREGFIYTQYIKLINCTHPTFLFLSE